MRQQEPAETQCYMHSCRGALVFTYHIQIACNSYTAKQDPSALYPRMAGISGCFWICTCVIVTFNGVKAMQPSLFMICYKWLPYELGYVMHTWLDWHAAASPAHETCWPVACNISSRASAGVFGSALASAILVTECACSACWLEAAAAATFWRLLTVFAACFAAPAAALAACARAWLASSGTGIIERDRNAPNSSCMPQHMGHAPFAWTELVH